MICPKCQSKMRVLDTRHGENITYRRYRCECGSYLYTTETQDGKAKREITNLIRIAKEKRNG